MTFSETERFTRYTLPFTRVLRVLYPIGKEKTDRFSVFVRLITHHACDETRQTVIEEFLSEDEKDAPTEAENQSEREEHPVRTEVRPCPL